MFFRKKLLGKILSLILIFFLWFNPLLVPVVLAEGESLGDSPEITVVQETFSQPETQTSQEQSSTSTPEVTQTFESSPTPAPESTITAVDPSASPTPTPQSTITTGDANASSEVKTTANTHQDTISGEINTPEGDCTPPEGETSCPNDITFRNDNSAEVSDSTSSQAKTGENATTGSSGNASIITGDATASGTIENEINSNMVILKPSPTLSVEPEALTGLHPVTPQTGEQTLSVENNNEGTVTNKANVTASTGQNLASENLGDVQIKTGDALALLNLLNLLNTNIVGSNFEVLILDLAGGENGDINLNEIWKQILKANGGDSLVLAGNTTLSHLQILVQNQNQAKLENNVNVSAGTGENQANENKSASIETGDATALANVTNIVNTNIFGSQFFFGVINLLGSFEGNLILPRPENFVSQNSSQTQGGGVIFENQNQAEISDNVQSLAETGLNEENENAGDNLIKTGNAVSLANTFSLVNLNIFRNNWFFLLVNNLGNWTGRIFGWSAPSAQEIPQQGSQIFELGLNEPTGEIEGNVQIEESPPLTFQNQNQATVNNNIKTRASTGQNQANNNQGDTSIQTGNAYSLANLFNLVNLNILGGRWFMGLVNVLGNWSGNTIFAYPDVVVSLTDAPAGVSPGDTFEYTLSFKNQGQDEAEGVRIEFKLPAGLTFLGDSSGIIPFCLEQVCSWDIGNLEAGQEGSFKIQVRLEPNFSSDQISSLLEMFIPKAYAAEKEASIIVNASIETIDPESDTGNNSAQATTTVYFPSIGSGQDLRQPVLEISAWNNVNEFVHPGDTVTFEITVKNKSDVPSYNTRLVQRLYNGAPEDFGTAEFYLGTIEPGKGGKLSFGLKLANDGLLPAGTYRTVAQAFGTAPNGNEVSSNEARTYFEIRRAISSLFEARAVGKEEGEILGGEDTQCPKTEDILPYILLLILSSSYLVNWVRPKLEKIK